MRAVVFTIAVATGNAGKGGVEGGDLRVTLRSGAAHFTTVAPTGFRAESSAPIGVSLAEAAPKPLSEGQAADALLLEECRADLGKVKQRERDLADMKTTLKRADDERRDAVAKRDAALAEAAQTSSQLRAMQDELDQARQRVGDLEKQLEASGRGITRANAQSVQSTRDAEKPKAVANQKDTTKVQPDLLSKAEKRKSGSDQCKTEYNNLRSNWITACKQIVQQCNKQPAGEAQTTCANAAEMFPTRKEKCEDEKNACSEDCEKKDAAEMGCQLQQEQEKLDVCSTSASKEEDPVQFMIPWSSGQMETCKDDKMKDKDAWSQEENPAKVLPLSEKVKQGRESEEKKLEVQDAKMAKIEDTLNAKSEEVESMRNELAEKDRAYNTQVREIQGTKTELKLSKRENEALAKKLEGAELALEELHSRITDSVSETESAKRTLVGAARNLEYAVSETGALQTSLQRPLDSSKIDKQVRDQKTQSMQNTAESEGRQENKAHSTDTTEIQSGGEAASGAGDQSGGEAASGASVQSGGKAESGAGDQSGGKAASGAGDLSDGKAASGAGDQSGGKAASGAGDQSGGKAASGAGDQSGGKAASGGGFGPSTAVATATATAADGSIATATATATATGSGDSGGDEGPEEGDEGEDIVRCPGPFCDVEEEEGEQGGGGQGEDNQGGGDQGEGGEGGGEGEDNQGGYGEGEDNQGGGDQGGYGEAEDSGGEGEESGYGGYGEGEDGGGENEGEEGGYGEGEDVGGEDEGEEGSGEGKDSGGGGEGEEGGYGDSEDSVGEDEDEEGGYGDSEDSGGESLAHISAKTASHSQSGGLVSARKRKSLQSGAQRSVKSRGHSLVKKVGSRSKKLEAAARPAKRLADGGPHLRLSPVRP